MARYDFSPYGHTLRVELTEGEARETVRMLTKQLSSGAGDGQYGYYQVVLVETEPVNVNGYDLRVSTVHASKVSGIDKTAVDLPGPEVKVIPGVKVTAVPGGVVVEPYPITWKQINASPDLKKWFHQTLDESSIRHTQVAGLERWLVQRVTEILNTLISRAVG
jgi:hypothetical protein